MPTQQQQQLQELQVPKIVDDDDNNDNNENKQQQNKEHQHKIQNQHQQQQQQNLSNNNSNNNINIINRNNSNNNKNNININSNMEKSIKRSTEKSNAPLLSASAQFHKDATVAALLQRNKQQHQQQQCTTNSTTSCSDGSNASFSSASVADSIQDDMSDQCSLTQAGLEEYNIRASSYYDQPVLFHHQKQSSYAQSEGYHSYVSSSDSSSATPFLDRLRQESEMLSRQSSHHWSQNDLSSVSCTSAAPSPTPTSLLLSTVTITNGGRTDGLLVESDANMQQLHNNNNNNNISSIITTTTNNNSNNSSNNNNNNNTNSSESTSSTETLKWLGSTSDVSEASHATGYSAVSESVSNSQLIVHSSRVLTPKRHHSESVLYLSKEQQQQLSPSLSPVKDNNQSQQQQLPQQQQQQQYQQKQQQIQKFSIYQQQIGPLREQNFNARPNVNHRHSPSYPPVHTSLTLQPYQHHHHQIHQLQSKQQQTSPTDLPKSSLIVDGLTSTPSVDAATPTTAPASLPSDLNQLPTSHKSSISVTISSSEALVTISPQTTSAAAASNIPKTADPDGASVVVIGGGGGGGSGNDEAQVSPSGISSISVLGAQRSNHRLFPVNTYTEHSNTSQFVQQLKPQYSAGLQKPIPQAAAQITQLPSGDGSSTHGSTPPTTRNQTQSSANSWQSVAELINDFERSQDQQPQKYAFMDPNKTQRISNPALKAFQKNAVQSYFERQQQQQQIQHQHQHSKEQLLHQRSYDPTYLPPPLPQHHQILRPHSFQASSSAKEVDTQELLRCSLPNAYPPAAHHHQLSPKQVQQQLMGAATKRLAPSISTTQINNNTSTDFNPPTANSPEPPPPPPRSRSLMPVSLLRRSSSASDYAEFRDQYARATQEKLQSQSIKNISSAEKSSFNDCGMPPPPPPRGRISAPERRTSSASEYAAMRDKFLLQQAAARTHQQHHPHQYARQQPQQQQHSSQRSNGYYLGIPSSAQPITTTAATAEGWVPERPPKNPNLRVPSPDLPPPPNDIDTSLSDEPLPPPPPEILHRQPYYDHAALSTTTSMLSGVELTSQANSPNRRNSFAGSTTRKTYYSRPTSHGIAATTPLESPTKIPPSIPKKPANIEHLHASPRSAVVMMRHSPPNKSPQPQTQSGNSLTNQNQNSHPNQNRKRPHNPGVIINVPPIPENTNRNKSNSSPPQQPSLPAKPTPPPPLKPRMPLSGTPQNVPAAQIRCNSKASYLPRQSLDKLNNSDPDHGSYKLTLTSNEDLVNNSKPVSASYDILVGHNGKLPNNLPDVLPLGAKLQQTQPASPTGGKVSPLRYSFGSNSSIASSPQQLPSPMYPLQHRYSTPTINSTPSYHAPSYIRSQSYEMHGHGDVVVGSKANKFMSQSTIDLKSASRIHTLDTTHEEETSTIAETPANTLSPAQSENNISSILRKTVSSPKQAAESNEMHASTEGRIFRAELVSTTLPNSPSLGSGNSLNKSITRKDSLRENIEKITQLQSKLMSAHLSDGGFAVSGYGVKPTTPQQQATTAALEKVTTVECVDAQQQLECNNSLERNIIETDLDSNCVEVDVNTATTSPILPPESTNDETLQQTAIATETPPPSKSEQLSLKLMQRSELILRVNPAMVEASSQTDDLTEDDTEMLRLALPQQIAKENCATRTTLQPRERHPIEMDCDKMCKELAALLTNNDKLVDIISPQLVKTPADYVENLYNPDVPLRPTKHDVGTSTLMRMKLRDRGESKNAITVELHYAEIDVSTLTNDAAPEGCDILKRKVHELMKHLKRKIRILGNEQTTIEEESTINDELGHSLVKKLAEKVRPIEASKFRTYIDDVGHITSLLLSLSERLARAENSLLSIEPDSTEKNSLETKRNRLLEQLEEAKRLKQDIDRRGSGLTSMLEKQLSEDDFADFDYFINMKAKLIADSRDISDKIKYGEEQLNALSETLVQSDC